MPAMPKTNGQRIFTYENRTIDLESSEPALKKDKNHTNNIMNGCTFELHPIPIENNNGNHLTNNNRTFYRLNNNHRNGITINNNHNTGSNGNHNDDANDNMKHQHHRNGSLDATKAMDDVETINDTSKS